MAHRVVKLAHRVAKLAHRAVKLAHRVVKLAGLWMRSIWTMRGLLEESCGSLAHKCITVYRGTAAKKPNITNVACPQLCQLVDMYHISVSAGCQYVAEISSRHRVIDQTCLDSLMPCVATSLQHVVPPQMGHIAWTICVKMCGLCLYIIRLYSEPSAATMHVHCRVKPLQVV